MKKIVSSAFFLLLTNMLLAQGYYQVTTETLNVRSDASKDADIIDKLHLGDEVYVIEYSKKWSQVKIDETTTGFVASKYISKDFNSSSSRRNNIASFSDFTTLIVIVIIAVVLYIIYYRYKRRCKNCRKWYAMERTDSEIISSKPSHKVKILRTTHNGKTTSTREVDVPATYTKYLITETCKYCGHKHKFTKEETTEN